MYGAIIGDIVGSVYERHPIKTKEFELFHPDCRFTDDTVMTVAIAETMLDNYLNYGMTNSTFFMDQFDTKMKKWGHRYPNAGYGRMFSKWLKHSRTFVSKSYGNGAAMRVSSIGWLVEDLNMVRTMAIESTATSHMNQEAQNGAAAVASAIFLAHRGARKEVIKEYIESTFYYDLNRSLNDIRPSYRFSSRTDRSIPESIIAFLEADDYEDAIRNAISLGGDADTQAAIAGSIAEAYYGIPEELISKAQNYLPDDILGVVDRFYGMINIA